MLFCNMFSKYKTFCGKDRIASCAVFPMLLLWGFFKKKYVTEFLALSSAVQ